MDNEICTEVLENEGGKVMFATDVIATIANLATVEVDGVAGMSGGVMEEITGKLGKKSYTKGIKVEVNDEITTIDMSIVVKYGHRIQDVCKNIQKSVKNAIETMTGLRVAAVNIAVQSIIFEKAEPTVIAAPKDTTEE